MWRNISFRSLIKLRNWGSLSFLIFPVGDSKPAKQYMQILTDEHLNTFLEWLLPHRLTPKRNKIFRQICGTITSQQFCHAQRSSPLRKKKKTKRKKTRRYVHDQGKRGKYAKTNWTG